MKPKYKPLRNLKKHLISRGISQRKFGHENLKIDPVYLNSIIQGRRQASPKLAKLIEKETGGAVPANEIRPDIF